MVFPILAGVSWREQLEPSLFFFCNFYYFYALPVKKELWAPSNYTLAVALKKHPKYTNILHTHLTNKLFPLPSPSFPYVTLFHLSSSIPLSNKSDQVPTI